MSADEVMHAAKRNDLIKGISLSDNPSRIQNSLLFAGLLFLCVLLVMDLKAGLLLLGGGLFLVTALLNPKYLYFLVISLFSVEGFTLFQSVSYPKLAGVLLITGLALRFALTKESLPADSSYKFFFIFFLGSIASFAVSKDLYVSVKVYIVYISLFVLYLSTRYFLKSLDDIRTALNYIFLSTLLAYFFVQFMGLSVRGDFSTRISSGMGDPNAYASYISVLIPLVLYRILNEKGKLLIFYWVCLTSFMAFLIMTASRGGLLGFLGMAGVLGYYYGTSKVRQAFFFILIVSLLAVFFVPEDYWTRISTIIHPEAEQGSSISYRVESYKAALNMFRDYPLRGVGLYNFKVISSEYGVVGGKVVHNTYLEILTGGGLIVFVPFLLILVNSWRILTVRKNIGSEVRDLLICLKASLASILITSFFLSADHEKILWFLLALISSASYISVQHNGIRQNNRILHS